MIGKLITDRDRGLKQKQGEVASWLRTPGLPYFFQDVCLESVSSTANTS